MIVKDMMPEFELYQPRDLKGALALVQRFGKDGWLLAGGHDSLSWFKDRIRRPKAVIDLAAVEGLAGVRETPEGVEIGAMTTLAEVERHPLIRGRFRLVAEAAARVASPQIRDSGTVGGNVAQHARCWYYRSGVSCRRGGGRRCFARALDSINREHALFGNDFCAAVTPSDLAPALTALDARMVIAGPRGQRVVDSADFFVGPEVDVTSLHCLKPDEILTAVRLPGRWSDAAFYFEKVSDRAAWDFALVSVAAAFRLTGGAVDDSRVVCGAVRAVPHRLTAVEQALKGKVPSAETAQAAGQAAAQGANPLNYNGYKVSLMSNLVMRAVRDARA